MTSPILKVLPDAIKVVTGCEINSYPQLWPFSEVTRQEHLSLSDPTLADSWWYPGDRQKQANACRAERSWALQRQGGRAHTATWWPASVSKKPTRAQSTVFRLQHLLLAQSSEMRSSWDPRAQHSHEDRPQWHVWRKPNIVVETTHPEPTIRELGILCELCPCLGSPPA